MDFKFTFEDGSEAIAHYGVKGMKWKKHKQQMDKAREFGDAYKNESLTNMWENYGDRKAQKLAQLRTDALYGKRGKKAYEKEARRRMAWHREWNKWAKKRNYKQGADGVWRRPGFTVLKRS